MLDDLLLLRLWAAPDAARGETRARAAADLRPIAADPSQGQTSWQAAFSAAAVRLAAAGQLVASGRQGARLQLTDAGRKRVREVFRVSGDQLARGGQRAAGWAWWRDRHALPLALGGAVPDTADGLRAALLRRLYLPESPARARASSLQKTVDLLLAKQLKVAQPGPGAFRRAALLDWVRQKRPAVAAEPERLPDALPFFAERALAAARRAPTGRFGGNKMFISHAWRALLAVGQATAAEEDAFKERLLRANTAGLLSLSRADLAGAHDPADVRASEIHYLGEKFHFVRLD